jgi:hypothetical protein
MCITIIRVQKNALRSETSEPIIKLGNYFSNTDFYKLRN